VYGPGFGRTTKGTSQTGEPGCAGAGVGAPGAGHCVQRHVLLETGGRTGPRPGLVGLLREVRRDELRAGPVRPSDGPRLAGAKRPTLFIGSRGSVNFTLRQVAARAATITATWGGVLRNPATVLVAALATCQRREGQDCWFEGLRADEIPTRAGEALAKSDVGLLTRQPGRSTRGWGERML